ncbi:MAG TPA: SpoIIE family protein phosphatase [Candidatus Cybelea sp.]|nr:SpoIIE family protein phosphatase [Candidatus Cybelea sp.]
MPSRIHAPLIGSLAFLAVVIGVLVVGGLWVQSTVTSSFREAESIGTARLLIEDVLRRQLDEETGVRGYAVDRRAALLQPYYEARAALPATMRRATGVLENLSLQSAPAALEDAAATNRRWLQQVAFPLLNSRAARPALQFRGKKLVDRVRADIASIETSLAGRESRGRRRAQQAIAWVDLFAIGAISAFLAAVLLFAVQQYRLGLRLEEERTKAEEQRRRSAEDRAAYVAEKRIADTLQEAFVQNVLPSPAMLRLGAAYLPASEEAKVGGDWYDAIELPGDRVLLAIGDVTGHGIEAAVTMNRTRQLLITCALIDPSPGPVLERVNNELMRNESPMVTAIAALVDSRDCAFAYASAGHPPAVLLEPGKRARFLEVGSLPLGVLPNAGYQTHRVRSMPGALLVLYTDGAIEHSRDVVQGEELLLAAIESAAHAAHSDLAAAICSRVFADRQAADDVAILTLRFADGARGSAPTFARGSQMTVAGR